MNNSDYYSRPATRYRAVIDITPKPKPELAPSWSPIRFAIILTITALVVVAVTVAVLVRAVIS